MDSIDPDARLRKLATAFPDFVISVDRDRRYLWINRFARGLTPADVEGTRLDDWVSPDSLPAMYPRLDEWRAIKARVDPDDVFRSHLSDRVGLTG